MSSWSDQNEGITYQYKYCVHGGMAVPAVDSVARSTLSVSVCCVTYIGIPHAVRRKPIDVVRAGQYS